MILDYLKDRLPVRAPEVYQAYNDELRNLNALRAVTVLGDRPPLSLRHDFDLLSL